MSFVNKANAKTTPAPIKRELDQTATPINTDNQNNQPKLPDTFSKKNTTVVANINPEIGTRTLSSRFAVFADDETNPDDVVSGASNSPCTTATETQNQSLVQIKTTTPKLEKDINKQASKLTIADDTKESVLSPELTALEKIAPGWGRRLAMIDPDKAPELNRLTFDQLMQDLDKAAKDGQIDEDIRRVVFASLIIKVNELKSSDTKDQYGVKQEASKNIEIIEMEQKFRSLQFQMMLDFIRSVFTRYDMETGEKIEPDTSSSDTHLQFINSLNQQQLRNATAYNRDVGARNHKQFANASLLDKAIHLEKLDGKPKPEIQSAIAQDVNRVYLIQQTTDTARQIQQGVSPEMKDRLIKNLTQEYQRIIPERTVSEAMVAEFVQARMTGKKTG